MRFMIIVKANKDSEAGAMPNPAAAGKEGSEAVDRFRKMDLGAKR